MKVIAEIKKEVFSGWDEDHFPECCNPDYLDCKWTKTGISKSVIPYGYRLYVKKGDIASIVYWIKKVDAEAMIKYAEGKE